MKEEIITYKKVRKNKSSGVLYIYIEVEAGIKEGDHVKIEKV